MAAISETPGGSTWLDIALLRQQGLFLLDPVAADRFCSQQGIAVDAGLRFWTRACQLQLLRWPMVKKSPDNLRPESHFDEATAALDTVTQREVSAATARLRGDRTVIVIAHRLSTIRQADMIRYMSGGSIGASGTYDELAKSFPSFRNLTWRASERLRFVRNRRCGYRYTDVQRKRIYLMFSIASQMVRP
ncbi:MAG: hypothetical protein KDE63_06165 [Novosphingobium sp.]|nr:hypothetical protein [Novosphingobium sp.]